MATTQKAIVQYLADYLNVNKIKDYCPNGLQVEGRESINRIVTGVTASQALIDEAIKRGADAILVHHGYFWKGEEQCVRGMKRQRLKALLSHDINLLAYHLPLDVHPVVGNNAQLAKRLSIDVGVGLEPANPFSVAMRGRFSQPLTHADLHQQLTDSLDTRVLSEGEPEGIINTVAWCTGGGQGYIDAAAEQGIDAFISGEVSEQTIHTAREMGIHFFAAGHHATERYGAKALGEHLAAHYDVQVEFVDIPNPA
ncbi:Nif3-like dinuclear metal center hexameric protein [Alteromonas oceanisediminis]|uniref:Nif3-like dinuclear metal center hexameric protein n=1 Tax=Alteromonas oceanisediminis TaxID=2836180 RepID=UPI001BDAF67E|nr:Nif3-like dinuclear metal center hexameric protein [Alteromonas oceanisediminis]MBT0587210.1 Nif3-like dinuclear metal center hexameric protein [Alteromonas oceanisediminis]